MKLTVRRIAAGSLGLAMVALVGSGCTAKLDPAQMSQIESAASKAEAAANRAQAAADKAAAAARSAADSAQRAEAAADKCDAMFAGGIRK